MAGETPVNVTQDQQRDLERLSGSANRPEAGRARAILLPQERKRLERPSFQPSKPPGRSRFAGPFPFAEQPDFGSLIWQVVETERRSPLALLQIPAEQQSTEAHGKKRDLGSPIVHPPIIVVMTSPPRAIVNFQ